MIDWKTVSSTEKQAVLQRPVLLENADLQRITAAIIEDVRVRGDSALQEYTERFDGVSLGQMQVSGREIQNVHKLISPTVKQAIDQAYQLISDFHARQVQQGYVVETLPGVKCTLRIRPLEVIGLYVPGGRTPLASTVLMLGVPAQIAGCTKVVLVSPPNENGDMAPEIIYAASKCGINILFKVGGAQAIAALAYGTKTIWKVAKIFGPGNHFVTEAKQQVSQITGLVGIDMPAGPSELLVVADGQAQASFIAADLLSQAEHGPDSQVILVSDSSTIVQEVEEEVRCQLETLERRDIAVKALESARFILVVSLEEAISLSNSYAPEHLILNVESAEQFVDQITHAGSIFLGPWSPESAGDYASGTNHVLPTYGAARFTNSLSVQDFQKKSTIQQLSREGLFALGETIMSLAQSEGLTAHSRSVSLRLKESG